MRRELRNVQCGWIEVCGAMLRVGLVIRRERRYSSASSGVVWAYTIGVKCV